MFIFSTLALWASNHCDAEFQTSRILPFGVLQVEKHTPPLPANMDVDAEFISKEGSLWLNNQTFHVKGINWFGFETDRFMAYGVDKVPQDDIMKKLTADGFNALRIPLTVNSILKNIATLDWSVNKDKNPHLNATRYLENLELFLSRSSQWGVVILLDMHRLHHAVHPDPLWYNEDLGIGLPELKEAWGVLADRFCDKWYIMGADLKNEPFSASWGDGTSKDWKVASEELANSIHQKCPRWILMVEGIGKAPTTPWYAFPPWGAELSTYGEYPIRVPDGQKLVYSPHVYGPGTLGETFLWHMCPNCTLWDGFTYQDLISIATGEYKEVTNKSFPQNLEPYYDILFGYLKLQSNYTLIVGEWGGTYIDPILDNAEIKKWHIDHNRIREVEADWQVAFAEYLLDRKIGSFYWCVNPESADTGGYFGDDWSTVNSGKQALLRRVVGTPVIQALSFIRSPAKMLLTCLESVDGPSIYRQNSDFYETEKQPSNKDHATSNPAVIVYPRGTKQTAAAIRCASEASLKICIRSGGHSYEGFSTCDGMLIDVRQMHEVEPAAGSDTDFWVGSGASNGEMLAALTRHGRMLPIGNHVSVGQGYALGCGRSSFARVFGLGCDFLTAARVVTAAGDIIEVSDSNVHKDLMWGLRGAGSGQFGVVTHLKYRTFPAEPNTKGWCAFKLEWPSGVASEAVALWQDWAMDHPNFGFIADLVIGNAQLGTVKLEGALRGNMTQLNEVLAFPISSLGPPILDERNSLTFTGLLASMTGLTKLEWPFFLRSAQGWEPKKKWKNKSHFVYKKLTPSGIQDLIRHAFERIPGAGPYDNWIHLVPWGGQIASAPFLGGAGSVFPHRSALALVQYGAYWDSPSSGSAMVNHQLRTHQTMSQYWGSGAYWNYCDMDLEDFMTSYWGTGKSLLSKLKCTYDPGMRFSFPQSIPCQSRRRECSPKEP